MRVATFVLLMMSYSISGWCQENVIEETRAEIDSILNIYKKQTDPESRFNQILGIYLTKIEAYPLLMLDCYKKLYLIGKENSDLIAESSAWSFAGQGYRLTGNYTKALDCHHKAIALAEKTGHPSLLGYAQNRMGHIYKDRLENERAIQIYQDAAANIAKGKNQFLAYWPSMNMGQVYNNANRPDSALFFAKKAYDEYSKLKDGGRSLPYILTTIGVAYSKLGNKSEAGQYFKRSILESEKSQSSRYMNDSYQAVAEHYYRFNMMDSARYYARKSIDVVDSTALSTLALKPAKLLMDSYESTNADSTLKYFRLHRASNDNLFSARANQQLQMMTFEEDQRQRDMVTEKETYKTKIKTNLLIGGLAGFSILAFYLYRNNRQKQKANILLNDTLTNLKSTQTQLIHSEKMASLGELTAGIAHEIQNPLNFVNNFSEVSRELIEELKTDKAKLTATEQEEILNDIDKNLEKIHHHGKRADSIVKGMLQHSRSGSMQKEQVDINALCEEYVRLAYHGLRAKDKSFNAHFETDLDPAIGTVNLIQQEIGRVILNLINNAFYAVSEKQQTADANYKPIVQIQTRKLINQIEIKLSDNGSGIPREIREKIFQPFFTTKPTGQGTGLGLSMSYDIITKGHGGTISVTSVHETDGSGQKTGTTFTITIPTTL
ncbi:MAG: hypothetical protein H7Y27_14915 [Gemmatimonadaceae bacterium]|nr:hypothetical protein [Chitinophagaceae bacterium]